MVHPVSGISFDMIIKVLDGDNVPYKIIQSPKRDVDMFRRSIIHIKETHKTQIECLLGKPWRKGKRRMYTKTYDSRYVALYDVEGLSLTELVEDSFSGKLTFRNGFLIERTDIDYI
jgi:hypothetical protein